MRSVDFINGVPVTCIIDRRRQKEFFDVIDQKNWETFLRVLGDKSFT